MDWHTIFIPIGLSCMTTSVVMMLLVFTKLTRHFEDIMDGRPTVFGMFLIIISLAGFIFCFFTSAAMIVTGIIGNTPF